jgi:putative transposase
LGAPWLQWALSRRPPDLIRSVAGAPSASGVEQLSAVAALAAGVHAKLAASATPIGLQARRSRRRQSWHHRDRGRPVESAQYTSAQFQALLKAHGNTCSMSRLGDVWDNAAMETFFSPLKIERIRGRVYRPRDEARADVFDYIERFYNPKRRHSTLGYLSPVDFEKQAMQA